MTCVKAGQGSAPQCHAVNRQTDITAPDVRVPRYTSYPTAPHFSTDIGSSQFRRWIAGMPRGSRLSLYLHIPYCDTLCWFCACRTQGTRRRGRVTDYLRRLEAEIDMVAALLPQGCHVRRVHLGGGSPTIMAPEELAALGARLRTAFAVADDAEIAVEIDPRDITHARLDALAAFGVTRASIGVQDFDPAVQQAINRLQSFDLTRRVIEGLRARGVGSLNIDALYGLPRQTVPGIAATAERLVSLGPDRLALFGYAHVPWMARRQQLIREAELPAPEDRLRQAETAREIFERAGYEPVGIDHFADPSDSLARAAAEGRLRRNFQGYVDDEADALIGLGASAISRLPQGYAQNAAGTADYQGRIAADTLATVRGHALSLDDRVRARAIERLLCDFRFDIDALQAEFGDAARRLLPVASRLVVEEPAALEGTAEQFAIRRGSRHRARIVAAAFDAYLGTSGARHSLAI